MLVIDDKVLKATGLDFDTAVALMEPVDGETVVHIKRELGPPEPQPARAEGLDTEASPGHFVTGSRDDATDQHSDWPPANLLGLPRLLPERGFDLGDVQRVASALHCTVQLEKDGRCRLVGPFGHRTVNSLAQAAACLNARSFSLEF